MSSLSSAVSDPNFPSPSLGLPSATPSPSLGLPSAAAPPSSAAPTTASRVESSGPRSLPPHLGFSQSKDVPSAAGPLAVRIHLLSVCKKGLNDKELTVIFQKHNLCLILDIKLNDNQDFHFLL